MARILVIQLARLGDVIQTTPLLRELLAQNPKGTVDVLVFDPLRGILDGLGLNTIYGLSERSLPVSLRQLDECIEQNRARLEPAPREALDAIRTLGLPRYDRIVNCTYSPLGALITQQMTQRTVQQAPTQRTADKHIVGPVITADGEVLFHHPAHVYIRARAYFRERSWFNLVDLWRASIPPKRAPSRDSRPHVAAAAALPFAIPLGRIVALNPGSSERDRRWPPGDFAVLAEGLTSHGLIPVLIGAPDDREICAEVQARSAVKLVNLCGQTSVPQLARLLSYAELLISNDTGAIHIAVAAGCRVLALFGATAYFAETAPWSEGNVVLQGPLGSDGVLLDPLLVLTAALRRLGLTDEKDLRREIVRHQASGWETFFLASGADPLGGLTYRPLHCDQWSPEERFTRELRHLFARSFCRDEQSASADSLRSSNRKSSKDAATGSAFANETGIARFIDTLESTAAAAERCSALSVQPSRPGAGEISSLATTLIAAVEELKTAAGQQPMVKPVVHFLDWQCRMMEPMAPEPTFQAHEREYRLAASLLREAAKRAGTQLKRLSVSAN